VSDKWASTNLPSRSEQRQVKRDALVRMAAQAFRTRGFHATSMEDIASALGVTKGALYRYVKNKQDILFECFMWSNRIGEQALEVARWHKGDGLAKLGVFITYFVENYLDHNTAGGAMVDIDALFPEQRQEVIAGRDKIDMALRQIVSDGIADGSIAERNAKLTVLTIMGSINWIPSWYDAQGAWKPREIAETMADIFVAGVRASKEIAAAPRVASTQRTRAASK
jgi:AcrR family transcriptional regulator